MWTPLSPGEFRATDLWFSGCLPSRPRPRFAKVCRWLCSSLVLDILWNVAKIILLCFPAFPKGDGRGSDKVMILAPLKKPSLDLSNIDNWLAANALFSVKALDQEIAVQFHSRVLGADTLLALFLFFI